MAELDPRTVVVTNGKTEREIAGSAWNILKSSKERGNTRKGWTFVRYAEPKAKKVAGVAPAAAMPGASTYIPPEVAAAATVAAAEATMLAGQTVTVEEVLAAQEQAPQEPNQAATIAPEAPAAPPAPVVVPPAPKAPAAVASPAAAKAETQGAPAAPYDGPKDDLQKVKNVGPKTEQVINSIGVFTYAQLRDVDAKALEAALAANGLEVKKALIPHWKKHAGDILNPPTQA